MKICYFTGTGNCLYVARRIGGELLSIPQLMKQEEITITDDAVGIVAPVYACEMPMMVREFMAKAKIETDYLFFVYTYGSGFGCAFAHAALAAREAGRELDYIYAVKMVDNYLPMFEMQEQMDTVGAKDVEGQLDFVCSEIAERKKRPAVITERTYSEMARFKKMLADPILRKETAQEYLVDDTCIHCGVCAQVCPANNIVVSEESVTFLDRCEVCYACLQNCPKGALHMREERSTVRFRNEHITLKEIIAAND